MPNRSKNKLSENKTKLSLLPSVLISQNLTSIFDFTRASNMNHEHTGHVILWWPIYKSGSDATILFGCSVTCGSSNTPQWTPWELAVTVHCLSWGGEEWRYKKHTTECVQCAAMARSVTIPMLPHEGGPDTLQNPQQD